MKVHKCKFIMCPTLSKRNLYFFFFLIGSTLRVLIPDLLFYFKYKNNDEFQFYYDRNKNDFNFLITEQYFEMVRNIISDLFFGIFHCYYMIRNYDDYKKRSQQTYNKSLQRIRFIVNDQAPRSKRVLKTIFIISIVDIICQLILSLKYIIEKYIFHRNGKEILTTDPNYLYCIIFFDIFARYFFSLWILKTYFYAHHYCSFILNIFGLIPITIVDIIVKFKKDYEGYFYYDIFYAAMISIREILYSLEDIINKVAFSTLYILPNTLIFYKGLCQLIYLAIISGLLIFIEIFFELDMKRNIEWEIQKFICFVPFNIIRTFFLVKVIDKFSAQHMTLLRVGETIMIFIYNKLTTFNKNSFDYNTWQLCLQIAGFIFLLISTLIHNEIIIINHPKLKAKTEYYLDKDADREQYSSTDSDTFFSNSLNNETATNLYSDLTGSDLS